MTNQHLRDKAWIFTSKYKLLDTVNLNYEQKAIGRNFKVEGASQTQDKTSHTIDLVYRPSETKEWRPQSFTIHGQLGFSGSELVRSAQRRVESN